MAHMALVTGRLLVALSLLAVPAAPATAQVLEPVPMDGEIARRPGWHADGIALAEAPGRIRQPRSGTPIVETVGGAWYGLVDCGAALPCTELITAPHAPDGLPDGAVPGSEVATGTGRISRAWLSEPTARIEHSVLGGPVAGALVIEDPAGRLFKLDLALDEAFEDRRPLIGSFGPEARDAVLAVRSSLTEGASLVAVTLSGEGLLEVAAVTPPLGAPGGWLNPIGIADVTGSGEPLVALVRDPGPAGELQLLAFDGRGFAERFRLRNAANHLPGTDVTQMAAIADFDGDKVPDIAVPDGTRTAIRILSFKDGQVAEPARIPLPAPVVTEIGTAAGFIRPPPPVDGARRRAIGPVALGCAIGLSWFARYLRYGSPFSEIPPFMQNAAERRPAPIALWGLRLVLLMLQLAVAAAVLHRFSAIDTAVAVNLILLSLAGLALGAVMGAGGLLVIWRRGVPGTGAAIAALLAGGLALSIPAYYLPLAFGDTGGADVATDTISPPGFAVLLKQRKSAGLDNNAPPVKAIVRDREVGSLVTDRSADDVFDLATTVVRKFDYNVVAAEAPGFTTEEGSIEATERSFVFGLLDDISIRIRPEGNGARVDIRSAARYPRLDFGRNAGRVRDIARSLKAQIDASVPSDPALAGEEQLPSEQAEVTPAGKSGGAKVRRRKKRVQVQPGAPYAPAPTMSRRL